MNLSGNGGVGPRTSTADDGSLWSSVELKENTLMEAVGSTIVSDNVKHISASLIFLFCWVINDCQECKTKRTSTGNL